MKLTSIMEDQRQIFIKTVKTNISAVTFQKPLLKQNTFIIMNTCIINHNYH